MNSDHQRLVRYFDSRSTTIDLPPGDPSSVSARVAGRRRRRRTAVSGFAALALLAGVVTVQQVGDDDTSEVAAEGAAVAAAPLQWTSVTPIAGLAYANGFAVTEDGTQYGLSTAPGRYVPNDDGGPQTLYRSTDGVEWTTVTLPADLWPSQLAAHGNDLYAVGTSPAAGGGEGATLARATGDGEWATTALPIDVAAIEAEAGVPVSVHGLDVSASPTGVVVSLQLSSYADPMDFLPTTVDGAFSATWTPTGVDVFGVPEGCELAGEGELDCAAVERSGRKPTPADPEAPLASFTFAELGVSDQLQSLISGELHVFASDDGTSFEEAPLPDGAAGGASLVTTDDGFALFVTEWNGSESTVSLLRSTDARAWTPDPGFAASGYPTAAGTIDGRASIMLWTDAGGALVAELADGTWLTTDLASAVSAEATTTGRLSLTTGSIGPLGAAAVLTAYDEATETEAAFAVYSPDGRSIAVQPLAGLPGGPTGYPSSVRVSADAVTIAFTDSVHDDGEITSTLLVGTPG